MQVSLPKAIQAGLILLCTGLLSCEASKRSVDSALDPATQTDTAARLLESLPALEPSGGPPATRGTSLDVVLQRSGSEYLQASSGQVDNGDGSISLLAPAGGLQYAIYHFDNLSPEDEISLLSAELFDLLPGEDYFLALADRSQARWRLFPFQPETAVDTFQIPLSGEPGLLGADGSLQMAVLCHDGQSARISSVRLFVGAVLLPPAQLSASFGTAWDRVELQWSDVPLALSYDIYYKSNALGDETYVLLDQVDGDTNTYSHSRSAPAGKECAYNLVYDYRVQSRAGIETSAGFSPVASGGRFFSDVLPFSASDRQEPDFVWASWEAAQQPGLVGITYEVYRNGELQLTTTQTSIGIPSPELSPDPNIYDFWVVPQTPDGPGVESQHDLGSEMCFEDYVLAPEQGAYLGLGGAMISGRPALAWYEDSPPALRYLGAESEAPLSAGDWQPCSITLPPDVSIKGQVELLEWQGRPLIVCRAVDADIMDEDLSGVQISLADSDSPQLPEDWQTIVLYNDLELNGSPSAAAIGGSLHLAWVTQTDVDDFNAFYFCSGDDPLNTLGYTANFLLESNVTGDMELDLAAIDEHPAILLAKASECRYLSTTKLDGAGPEDWSAHTLTALASAFRSPRLAQCGEVIGVSYLCGNSDPRYFFGLHQTVAGAGLSPDETNDWTGGAIGGPGNTAHINCVIGSGHQDFPFALSYGTNSGDDLAEESVYPGLVMRRYTEVGGSGLFTSHRLHSITVGMEPGQMFIPEAPGLLEDLSLGLLRHGGQTAFALAVNPADDGAGMQLQYFHMLPALP